MPMQQVALERAHRLLAPRLVFMVGTRSVDNVVDMIPVSNVTSVSTAPEMIALAVYREWQTCDNLLHGEGLTVSVPMAEQLEAVWKLGGKYSGYAKVATAPKSAEFREMFDEGFSTYGPVLKGAIGWMECRTVRKLTDLGDHVLFVASVLKVMVDPRCYDKNVLPAGSPKPLMQWVHNKFATSGGELSIEYFE